MYKSEFEGPNRIGRPCGRWKDRVEEYLGERGRNGRGELEPARGCIRVGRGGDFSAMATPARDVPSGSKVLEL